MSENGNDFFVAPVEGRSDNGAASGSRVVGGAGELGGGSGTANRSGSERAAAGTSREVDGGAGRGDLGFGSLARGGFGGSRGGTGGQRGAGSPGASEGSGVSGNLGLVRQQGPKRVVGASRSVASLSADGNRRFDKSYAVAATLQFNLVEEMAPDAISRDFAQEIIEELFVQCWGLSTGDATAMRKAEDVVFAFLVMRGASPYANYDFSVMIGERVVELDFLSTLLASKEVTRRRFIRALADDLRRFVKLPENGILRDRVITRLGINSQYVSLGFDGSTHCTGMNRNEVAFTKALESRNLFDDESVKGSLRNSSLIDGVFDSAASGPRRGATLG